MNNHGTILEILEILNNFINSMDEEVTKAYGKSLKTLREHTGITQVELAELTKIPRQSISVYERGTTIPTVLQAYKIALYFGLTIDDFIVYGLDDSFFETEYKSITDKYDALHPDEC